MVTFTSININGLRNESKLEEVLQPSGLISRVTDTVKSIVPSWLQKYFRNGEAAEGGGFVGEAEENSRAPPPNGSEEVAPPPDGRDSQSLAPVVQGLQLVGRR
ncbi:hypothetical protein DPEC_G00378680 [Dallia pectoralis]|nr:hypothetical protein DPEC_G00378680 [Dallia pectoralis]